jgi:hypothetical protein
MIIDPNFQINTRMTTILLHQGTIFFTNGDSVTISGLSPGNVLETLCKKLDPNLDYISVLLPDVTSDKHNFFEVRKHCNENKIYAQSTIEDPDAIWDYWKRLCRTANDNDNDKTQLI